MRSVLVVHSQSERYGGDRAVRSLAGGLAERGWDVTVTLPGPGPLDDDLRADGRRVEHRDPGVLRRVNGLRGWLGLVATLPGTIRWYRRRASSVDVVHVNTSVSLGATIGARLARRPIVFHLRESYADHQRAWRWYARLLRRLVTHVVAVSNGIADEARAVGFASVSVVHDGIEFEDRPPERATSSEAPVVTVGRINDWKGHDVLVDAAAILRSRGVRVAVVIAGDVFPGGERHRALLEERIAARDVADQVTLAGFVDDVGALLARAAIFVLPSRRPEPFGLALVEAMASGLPCVATAAGGPLDIIEPEVSGILVPPNDAAALADAVERLWRDAALRARLGASAAVEVRRRFSVSRSAAAIDELYRELLGVAAAP